MCAGSALGRCLCRAAVRAACWNGAAPWGYENGPGLPCKGDLGAVAWAASLPVAAIVANVAAYHLHPAVGVVIGVVVMVGVWATVLSNPARTAAEEHVADR